MRLVPQITKFTCALACLEAHSADNGLPHTQGSFLENYPDECNVGHMIGGEDAGGALTGPQFEKLCEAAGLPVQVVHDTDPAIVLNTLNSLGVGQSAILHVGNYKHLNVTHCVRVDHVDAGGVVHVMCPCMTPQGGAAMPDTLTLNDFADCSATILIVG